MYRLRLTRTLSSKLLSSRFYSPASVAWSYSHGSSDKDLVPFTIGQVLDISTEKWPDRTACIFPEQDVKKTFQEFKEEADTMTAGLIELGYEPGDRLGIFAPNLYEWVLTAMAAAKAGLILVLVNPAYMTGEVKQAITQVRMKGIVSAERFKHHQYYQHFQELIPGIENSTALNSKAIPSLKHIIMISGRKYGGTVSFSEVMKLGKHSDASQSKVLHLKDKIQFDDVCNIQFTSGTTGTPKGVQLTHHGLVNNAALGGYRLQYDQKHHTVCVTPPLYHCFGCIVGFLNCVFHGGTVVYPSQAFDPRAAIKAIETERCTSLYGTPTMFVDMLKVAEETQADVSSLETGVMAGSPCPEQLVNDVISRLGIKEFLVMYGLTETSPLATATNRSDSASTRSQTIGSAMQHTELLITDSEGQIVPRGVSGELCVRGYSVFNGYWEQPDKTAEAITNTGWFKTGDIAYMREDGNVNIAGRVKEMVIRGGENIYPREVEEFLLKNTQIIECYVFGVPDKRMGEELAVWIRCKDGITLTEQDVRNYCKGKISHFKIPRYIMFRDDYPKTISGKIQKYKMRERMVEELGLKQ